MRKLERRDLWASGNTAIIILGLTALVVSLSISLYLKTPNASFGWHLSLAVWALVALVVFGPERLPGLARSVGLWVGNGSGGDFANLSIIPA